jgi:hypothetical protein
MSVNKLLLRVEESINSMPPAPDAIEGRFYKIDVSGALSSLPERKTAFEYVEEKLIWKGFAKKSGKPDIRGFYNYAQINEDTWSDFRTGIRPSSKETLYKIIIALRLNLEQADEFLSLAGRGFRNEDFRDKVIRACIYTGVYDIDDVYEVLETYGNQLVFGKPRFKNIYRK